LGTVVPKTPIPLISKVPQVGWPSAIRTNGEKLRPPGIDSFAQLLHVYYLTLSY
jgi:hypothetical protein